MKGQLGYLVLAATAAGIAAAENSPGFVSLDINTHEVKTSHDQAFSFFKRSGRSFYESALINKLIFYSANIGVGTPAQYFPVTIDTGSSDFWIAASPKLANPYFDSKQSSTYNANGTQFSIHYVKGSNTGTWATDVVSLGDIKVDKMPFGDVTDGLDLGGTVGVMGIGSMKNEAPVILKTGQMYPNFPQKLKDQKVINKVAYSLFLNSLNSTSGTLLFGGVDRSRFSGDLYTVPIIGERSLDVELTSLNINGLDVAAWDSVAVTLDSGTSFTYLPNDAISEIGSSIRGATLIGGLFFIDSRNFDWNQYLEFDFSGAVVRVNIRNLCLKTSDVINPDAGLPSKYDYVVGILSNVNSRGYNLLGDTFLRSAYVVYNLEDWEISIAQASYNTDFADIQPIISKVPHASRAPNY